MSPWFYRVRHNRPLVSYPLQTCSPPDTTYTSSYPSSFRPLHRSNRPWRKWLRRFSHASATPSTSAPSTRAAAGGATNLSGHWTHSLRRPVNDIKFEMVEAFLIRPGDKTTFASKRVLTYYEKCHGLSLCSGTKFRPHGRERIFPPTAGRCFLKVVAEPPPPPSKPVVLKFRVMKPKFYPSLWSLTH